MGTSVQMIEAHYGHINPVKNAERILQGLPGWQSVAGAMPANGPKGKGVVRYACDVAGPGDTTTNSMPYSWPTTGICG